MNDRLPVVAMGPSVWGVNTFLVVVIIVLLVGLSALLFHLGRLERAARWESSRQGLDEYEKTVADVGDPGLIDVELPPFVWPTSRREQALQRIDLEHE